MTKLLIVAYHFPPRGGATGLRALKMAKYLPEYGVDTAVLTLKDIPLPWATLKDDALLPQLPNSVKLIRTSSLDPVYLNGLLKMRSGKPVKVSVKQDQSGPKFDSFFLPDVYAPWVPIAVAHAVRHVRTQGLNCIMTTGPPHSVHLIGYWTKQITGVQWLMDYRDTWSTNPMYRRRPGWPAKLERRLESALLRRADAVVATSEPMRQELRALVAGEHDQKFTVVYNGWDEDDFIALPPPPPVYGSPLRFCYAGSLGGHRRPEGLFKGIAEFVRRHQAPSQIRFVFAGAFSSSARELAQELEIEEHLDILGALTHDEAIRLQSRSHALVILLHEGEGASTAIPAKTYECIALRKPVVAIMAEGPAREILSAYGPVVFASPEDPASMADAFATLVRGIKEGNLPLVNKAVRARYTRRSQAAVLAHRLAGAEGEDRMR